jgi:putative acetyltransferase
MTAGEIAIDDPRAADVQALLRRHLAFAHTHTPAEHAYALDIGALLGPAITFCSYRAGGELLAVGALHQLDGTHGEIKSMHTAEAARGRGIGRAMLGHLIELARDRGLRRVSLETGTMAAFGPARALYASAGFIPCGPFGGYQPSPDNTFMTLGLA